MELAEQFHFLGPAEQEFEASHDEDAVDQAESEAQARLHVDGSEGGEQDY